VINARYCAASMTVATCVLSPISARKKATNVVPNTPQSSELCLIHSELIGNQRPDSHSDEAKVLPCSQAAYAMTGGSPFS